MGSLWANVGEDGKLQTQTTSGDSLSQSSKKSNNTVDSDMFLSLLVAEMQNQDPLEPTSNTEWVSQYATFTQVEKMTEMSESIDLLRANELIGKTVVMKVTSVSTGDVTYKQGVVDYITVENGKPILIIDENKYSLSDLDSVMTDEYSEAYQMYTQFSAMVDALPDIKFADKSYENVVQGAYDYYNSMDDYQKSFMQTYAGDSLSLLEEWKDKLKLFGVEIDTTSSTEKGASLDDILESFNTKINAIIDKLNLLTGTEEAESGEAETDSGDETETA